MIWWGELVIGLLVFFSGAAIGSFVNLVALRLPARKPLVWSRSSCPHCGEAIYGVDLFPLAGFFLLGGRCRSCGGPIAKRYPAVEVVGGILFVLVYQRFGFSLAGLLAVVVTAILLCVTLIDGDTMEIPNRLVMALAVPAVAAAFVFHQVSLLDRAIGFFAVSLPMLLLAMAVPNAFGGGDVKLMAVAGFLLGWQNILLATFLAVLLGGGYGVFLMVFQKADAKKLIPFGPCLCVGVFVALLYGEAMLRAYLDFLMI